MEQELERLEGTVEDIIYLNEDNGYTVFEVSGGGVVTVVCGVVGELHAGESVVCRGRYENHATYGRQFHAQECETDMPKDLEAVYAFLASRSLPYIGARTADKIIDRFGAAALEVIANDPAQLTLIPGISADKADRIQQEFKRMFGMRELIAYLAQFEISPRRAMEVFRTFGPGAMQAIQQNPYLLCGEPLQLDFRHADSIAQYYQMAGDCAQRLEAALLRTLRHNAGNGHTCLPRAQLLETASNFIHQPPEKLAAALDSFRGETQQVPSMYSALKYQGKKLYEYARQGIEVPREARPITVYELLFIRREGDELELEIHCSKGTYIRTIIDDLGEKLGCGAHVIFLRRLAVSKYPVERMVTLEQLQALVDEAAAQDIPAAQLLDPLLMPMDSPASDYPLVNIPETSAVYFKNGNPVRQSGAPLNGLVRVMESESGKFLGMGEIDDEGRVAPRRLVVEYPA